MGIDAQRLRALCRYEDRRAGLREEFLERRLGPGRALALLSSPLGERRSPAWVIAPSIGPEHGNLRRLETLVARALAGAGFAALRIRPDLHPDRGASGEIDLDARMAEVEDAITVMGDELGLGPVGLAGTLFGGTLAGLAAERHGAPALVLVEPVTRGRRYVRETVRRQAVAELMAATEEGTSDEQAGESPGTGSAEEEPARRPLDELAASGQTTVRGLRLTQAQFDRIAEVDLVEAMRGFAGRTLLAGVTASGAPSPGVRKLRSHLESLGGAVTFELFEDPLPAPLGEYYYRNAGPVRIDTRLELDQRIAHTVAEWAVRELGGAPGLVAA
jgi:pimeloyl-ACP methyl ester carboxylesterase